MAENLFDTGKYEIQVHALVALLDEAHTARVKEIWSLLDVNCGLKAINATPFPHFSFHIAYSYALDELENRLTELTRAIPPFSVRTTGLSIFTGAEPVVFVPLVADQNLLSVHQTLWEETSSYGENLSRHYRPGRWVPHITLANKDVNVENIDCVARHLVSRSFEWKIQISQLAVVCQSGGLADMHAVYPLRRS
ncbi:MAG: 2'-5' RNA ligase family protein [Anaerolineales bacterium]|jgi:hypothetical protein